MKTLITDGLCQIDSGLHGYGHALPYLDTLRIGAI